MLIHRHHDFIHRKVQTLGRCLDNADIRLMRNQPIELLRAHLRRLQHLNRHVAQRRDRVFKDRLTIHIHIRIADHLPVLNRAGNLQNRIQTAIGMNFTGQNTRFV